jgi:uncharacterized protein (DUF924 family)
VANPEEIIEFWFGGGVDPVAVSEGQSSLWWGKSEETDRTILERFGATLEQAAAGELNDWCETPRGTLALIIVLDQFTRVIHRDTGRMYENDPRATDLCTQMIDGGTDEKLPPIQRVFGYMPLMHAESLELQERGVQAFQQLAEKVEEGSRAPFESFVKFAIMHRDIVARFGHFPHRNELVGRETTAEEAEFLKQPNSSF